jgi:hypothetical protein
MRIVKMIRPGANPNVVKPVFSSAMPCGLDRAGKPCLDCDAYDECIIIDMTKETRLENRQNKFKDVEFDEA